MYYINQWLCTCDICNFADDIISMPKEVNQPLPILITFSLWPVYAL